MRQGVTVAACLAAIAAAEPAFAAPAEREEDRPVRTSRPDAASALAALALEGRPLGLE